MFIKFKLLAATTAFLVAIPLLGLWIGSSVERRYDEMIIASATKATGVTREQAIEQGIGVRALCAQHRSTPEMQSACQEVDHILLLRTAGWYTFITGLALIGIVFFSGRMIGNSRARLALMFNPVATLSIVVLSVSIFAQGIILVYALYLAGAVYAGLVFPKLLILLGLGALVASFGLIQAAFSFLKNKETPVRATHITEENGAPLLAFINQIANKVQAKAPDNVVVGIEPNFYVTAAKTRIVGDHNPLHGTTMYLAMPFLEIFNREELAAVVGHELGHFKGEDTAFSMRFYPAYAKINAALYGMQLQKNSASAATLFALPAISMLSLVLASFGEVERTIGRARELEADKVGASAGSKESIVSALLKMSEYARLWGDLRSQNIGRLAEGDVSVNLPNQFCNLAQHTYANLDFEAARSTLFEYQMAHPTDTHPTLLERMTALGVPVESIGKEVLAPALTPLSDYLIAFEKTAEEISMSEHRLMVDAGLVVVPQKQNA